LDRRPPGLRGLTWPHPSLEVAGIAIWAWVAVCIKAGGGGDEGPRQLAWRVAVFALALLGKNSRSAPRVSQFGICFGHAGDGASRFRAHGLGALATGRRRRRGSRLSGASWACFWRASSPLHWRIERDFMAAKGYPVGEGADRFWADSRGKKRSMPPWRRSGR